MLRAEKPATIKVETASQLEGILDTAASVLLADFSGMPVSDIDVLRRKCFQNKLKFKVAKNRIARLVLEKLGYTGIDPVLTGSTGFCIGFDDPILPIKILKEFSKEKGKPNIKGCLIDGRYYNESDVTKLMDVPPRDVLLSMVVGAISAPLSGFVNVINEILRTFVAVLDALTQKMETEGITNEGLSATGGSVQNIIEQIEKMSVLELVELKKALEDKFGVTAAAPMMMGGMMPASAGAAEAVAEVEEQTEFTVMLTSGGDKKIQVIKEVRAITNLGLKEAKDLVDGAPKPIKEGVSKEEAMAIKAKIEEAGGQVDLK